MSLFTSFKKALGFPDEYEDLEDLSDLEDDDEQVVESEGIVHTQSIDADYSSTKRESAEKRQNTAEMEEHRKQIESLKLSSDRQRRALNSRIAQLEQRINVLEAENEQLQLENQSMVNKLRGVVMPTVGGDNRVDVSQLNEENGNLRRELNNVKRQLAMTEKKLQQVDDPDRPSREEMKEIEEKIDKFSKIKADKEAEIQHLKTEIKLATGLNEDLQGRVNELKTIRATLEQTVLELNSTIEHNLRDHALTESELHKEIERLNALLKAAEQKKSKKNRRYTPKKDSEQKPSVRISAIDELMDNTDWFAAPEPGPRMKDPEVIESFGYKETTKKQNKKFDENQLTLF